jgi:hypothetical protein
MNSKINNNLLNINDYLNDKINEVDESEDGSSNKKVSKAENLSFEK